MLACEYHANVAMASGNGAAYSAFISGTIHSKPQTSRIDRHARFRWLDSPSISSRTSAVERSFRAACGINGKTVACVGEVARPTLRVRGLLGRAEPILITGRRAVADYREAFVGIDVAKLRNAIAIADSGREGEVRFFGEVDASDGVLLSQRAKLVASCRTLASTAYGVTI